MKKTYKGSCHCGAVAFESDIDLDAGTIRCNCKFCRKARFWFAIVPTADFRLLRGESELVDYQHVPAGKAEPFIHLLFCKHCGVRAFSRAGYLPAIQSEFCGVNIGCLDDASDEELARAPISFVDGRNDNFTGTSEATRYL